MATGLKQRLDYGDYCAIPPSGNRWELIDGAAHVTPAPSPQHQRRVFRLAQALAAYFRPPAEVFVAPIDVLLAPHDVVQPDIVVVGDPGQVSERGIEGPPLMVVEVLSPATLAYDRTTKAQRYAALRVVHYWIVDDQARALECFRLGAGGYAAVVTAGQTLEHPDFPGLRLDLAALWQ
jgi:Uma2 family endonuclease